MKLKNILLLALIAALAWFFFTKKKTDSPPPPTEDPPAAPQTKKIPTIQTFSQKVSVTPSTLPQNPIQPSSSPTTTATPQPPAPHLVEFEIIDGLAIAFGDVLLGQPDTAEVLRKGYAQPPTPQTWPSETIAYAISSDLSEPERVIEALEYFHEHTPVRFVPLSNQKEAIIFEPGNEHCYSYLGRTGGHQPIVLSNKCYRNEIIHEIMHALGFIHEQSRTDRDQYVDVLWQNIDEKFHAQFHKAPEELMKPIRGSAFDYTSIMLYAPEAFAHPGQVSMRSKTSTPVAPQKQGLSEHDITRIKALFKK